MQYICIFVKMDLKEDKIEPDIADSELDPTGLLSYCRLSEVQGVPKNLAHQNRTYTPPVLN